MRRDTVSVPSPYHVSHVGEQYVEIGIVDLFSEMVVFVGQGIDHVADVLVQDSDVLLVHDVASDAVVDAEFEVTRERVSVPEDILDDALVCSCGHSVEILAITDVIDVRPGGEVDICVFLESELFTIDYHLHTAFQDYDYEMVFGSSGLAV